MWFDGSDNELPTAFLAYNAYRNSWQWRLLFDRVNARRLARLWNFVNGQSAELNRPQSRRVSGHVRQSDSLDRFAFGHEPPDCPDGHMSFYYVTVDQRSVATFKGGRHAMLGFDSGGILDVGNRYLNTVLLEIFDILFATPTRRGFLYRSCFELHRLRQRGERDQDQSEKAGYTHAETPWN